MANACVTYHLDTRELDKLAAALNGNRMDVLTAAGFEVEQSAKKRAPYRTGALSNSIRSEKYDENTVRITPGVNYAPFVELGTSRMSARPYLFPALEEVINAINQGKFWERLFKR